MADDPTPEVMNALVRLMNNETDLESLDNAALYALGSAARGGKTLLQRVVAELNRRGELLKDIGAHYGVSESTASRWAKPKGEAPDEEVDEP
jgi:hypothetical protein